MKERGTSCRAQSAFFMSASLSLMNGTFASGPYHAFFTNYLYTVFPDFAQNFYVLPIEVNP